MVGPGIKIRGYGAARPWSSTFYGAPTETVSCRPTVGAEPLWVFSYYYIAGLRQVVEVPDPKDQTSSRPAGTKLSKTTFQRASKTKHIDTLA